MKYKVTLLESVIMVTLFFALWFGLSNINWVKILNVQETKDTTEEKLGDLFWEFLQQSQKENTNPIVVNALDTIVTALCSKNSIEREFIKVHILEKDEVNAFALPNGHVIVYTGLIKESENYEELSGVLAHEIVHITHRHVMKKLVKEFGLSVLLSMIGGNSGTQIVKEAVSTLSSSAFDRKLEKEADIVAVDYLVSARINPEPFADFLYRMSTEEPELLKNLSWISTHPDSEERAKYILEYSKKKKTRYKSVLSEKTWDDVQEELSNE